MDIGVAGLDPKPLLTGVLRECGGGEPGDLRCGSRHAATCRRLHIFCQAQIDENQGIIGPEALLHWGHPERELVLPFDLIPLAEDISALRT